MSIYSDKLSLEYSKNRDSYTATDFEVFNNLERLGIQGKRILDFGCGDGRYSFELVKRGAQTVVGIDVSPAMIDLAKENASKQESGKIQFMVADGEELAFPEKSFDLVFANFVLHHFKDLVKPLGEIYRVLIPGGYVVATFSSYDLTPEGVNLINTEIPIQLGHGASAVVVHNIIKSYKDVELDFKDTGFSIDTYRSIENPNASIDPSYPHLDKVKKLTMLSIAHKS